MTETEPSIVLHLRSGQTLHCNLDRPLQEGDTSVVVRADGGSREIGTDELKAVFFVRPSPAEPPEFAPDWSRLAVEFADGEIIRGVAAPYAPSLSTFFLYPLERSKNERVLVVTSAVVSIDVEKF